MNPQEEKSPELEMGQRVQAFFESLQVKLTLGKAELQDLWSEEKKDLLRYIHEQKHRLENREGELPEQLRAVKGQLHLLESELEETGEKLQQAFETQQPRLRARLHELEVGLKASADTIGREMNHELESFRGRMEAMSLRKSLDEAGEDLEAFGEKVRAKGPQLWKNLRTKEVTGDVSQELGKAWDHIRKAADELFG